MTANIAPHTAAPARQRRITTAAKVIVAAGAIAMGAMSLSPALANAEPVNPNKPRTEKAIKADCEDAGGGYSTSVVEGHRKSECSYSDSDGYLYVDKYTDGTYTGTSGPFRTKQTPTLPPGTTVILPPGQNTRAAAQ